MDLTNKFIIDLPFFEYLSKKIQIRESI
jgi:hypothetical protein